MFGLKKKKGLKVLVVEDDALLARVLTQYLIKQRFSVAQVSNGLDVVNTVKSFEPDIILLDLILPGLDGFGVLKQLRADEKMKTLPVMVISNIGEIGDVKSARALGAKEYFIKANTQLAGIVDAIKKHV